MNDGSILETVYVIRNFLSTTELNALRSECDENNINKLDLSLVGSSIDLFENSSISENHPARKQREYYFRERYKNRIFPNETILQHLLINKFPSIVKWIDNQQKHKNGDDIYLFNEHYVVKEKGSDIAFRWHRDCDEQLGALPFAEIPKYYSMWCTLDQTTSENGTLIIPKNTLIKYLKVVEQQNDIVKSEESSTNNSKRKMQSAELILSEDFEDPVNRFDLLLEEQKIQTEQRSPFEQCMDDFELTLPECVAVVFSSTLWHRSNSNRSDSIRRVFYAQYSTQVISAHSDGEAPLCFAVKCSPFPVELQTKKQQQQRFV